MLGMEEDQWICTFLLCRKQVVTWWEMMHFFYQCCCESSLPQGLEGAAACQGASRAGSLQEMVYMWYRSLSTVFGVCVLWLRKAVFTPCEKNTFKQVIAFVCFVFGFFCVLMYWEMAGRDKLVYIHLSGVTESSHYHCGHTDFTYKWPVVFHESE